VRPRVRLERRTDEVFLPASCTLITEKGSRKSVVSSLAWRCSRSSTESVRAALAAAGIDPKIEGEWECAYTDQNGVEHVIGIKYEDGTTTPAPVKKGGDESGSRTSEGSRRQESDRH